jgi:circadian clock protein KaiB
MTSHVLNNAKWILRMYVAGETPKAQEAIATLKRICETRLHGNYAIEVVDLAVQPERARDDQIVALPTLVRRSPLPVRQVIGDLSCETKVLTGLGLDRTDDA